MKPTRTILAILATAAVACLVQPLSASDVESDVAALKARGIKSDGESLLALIKKRTPTADVTKKIDGFMKQLDDDDQKVRDKATEGLVDLGALARGRLADATKSTDAEIRKRARWALEKIGPAEEDATILPAAARLLASKKQAGALEALLEFLPHIDKPEVADDVAVTLAPLAADKDGKPDPLALKALSSKSEVVRHAAGHALAKVKDSRAAVRKLLEDKSVGVRRRVALALLHARDKEAIPALVKLTGEDSEDDAFAAEDALSGLAGDKAPDPVAGDDAKARMKIKQGWEKWWKDAGPKFDLAKADLEEGGGTRMAIMGVQNNMTGVTKLHVLDAKGATKHTISSISYPPHASMVKRDRALVCDQNNGRVVEVDMSGKVIWEKRLNQPIAVHGLRNGRTFVTMRNQLLIMDRAQKDLIKIDRPGWDIVSARAFDDGTVSLLVQNGEVIRFGKDGKETGKVTLAAGGIRRGYVNGTHAHFNRDGSCIVPDYYNGQVRAFDKAGKEKWSASVANPWSVSQVTGGNLIISTRSGQTLYELDRNGKEKKKINVAEGIPLFYDRR